MEDDVKKSGLQVLAYKISPVCSCGKTAKYYLLRSYMCESCFQKKQAELAAKGTEVIFPSYQEPKFGYTKSNMLTYVQGSSHNIGAKWGKRLHQGHKRSSSGGGSRKKLKPLVIL